MYKWDKMPWLQLVERGSMGPRLTKVLCGQMSHEDFIKTTTKTTLNRLSQFMPAEIGSGSIVTVWVGLNL